MKKWLSLFLITAFACAQVEEMTENTPVPDPNPEIPSYTVTLTASMEEVKTSYAGDKTFSWSAGDQISVLFNNGTDNKFFTFTNVSGEGATAKFVGKVWEGYANMGAKDTGAADGVNWALFPASDNHTYTAGASNPISFYVAPVTDFTEIGHFSANIPMEARGVDRGDGTYNFMFHHIAGAYKMKFTGLNVSKVKLITEHVGSTTYRVSGAMPVYLSGSEYYLKNESGSGSKVITFIRDVDEDGTATFYIPFRSWAAMQPKFTLINMDDGAYNGYTLLVATAKTTLSQQANLGHMAVLPEKEAPGTGVMFYPGLGIGWNGVTNVSDKSEGIVIKGTADQDNLYLLFEIDKRELLTDSSKGKANKLSLYLGNENSTSTDWKWSSTLNTHNGYTFNSDSFYLTNGGVPSFYNSTSALITKVYSAELGDKYCYEMQLTRSNGDYSFLESSAEHTAHVGVTVFNQYYDGGSDYSHYIIAPTREVASMFEVALPGPSVVPVDPGLSGTRTVYTETLGEVINPERGFYTGSKYGGGDRTESSSANTASKVNAAYAAGYTLIYTGFYLPVDSNISSDYLTKIQSSLAAFRGTGVKCILRFAYSRDHDFATIPWDATKSQILSHISQLKPILQEYKDVIYVLQAGFIGSWGEWYYTTHFSENYDLIGDGHFPVNDTDFANRREVVDALLDALPECRQVALRTPQFKMRMYDLSVADTLSFGTTAHDGTTKSRLAAHNDCFGASSTDSGTFGNETGDALFWKGDSRYIIMGGETCKVADPYCECSNILSNLKDYHWSYLNSGYRKEVLDRWASDGCFNEIRDRLGYRLVLLDSYRTETPAAGSQFDIAIRIQNKGFAAPMNPRDAKLIWKDSETGDESVFSLTENADPRDWHSGINIVRSSFTLPSAHGTLYLKLSDPLCPYPKYCIALANDGVFNSETGYNKILEL